MSVFVTSDLHFGHNKPFIYEPRGFESVEEMNEEIIQRWNSIGSNEDEVYVLGDLALGDHENVKMIEQLNGKIHVILGNHDTSTREKKYAKLKNVVEVVWATKLTYRKYNFFLSHFPCLTANFDNGRPLKERTINLCGHNHTKNPFEEMEKGILAYHVELDAHDCYPIALDDVIESLKRKYNLLNHANMAL